MQLLNMRTRATLLTLSSIALAACGGGGGSDGSIVPPASVTISGKAEYEFVNRSPSGSDGLNYADIEVRPIRGATVRIVDAGNSQVLAETVTDDNGDYSATVPSARNVFVRILAEAERSGTPSWDFEVRDNTSNTNLPAGQRPIYALDGSAASSGVADSTRNLLAATGWNGTSYAGVRAAAPFSILDVAYTAAEFVLSVDADAQFAPLDMFWSVNNCPRAGSIETGDIGTSFYTTNPANPGLFLLGCADEDTEEFDVHVIAHEWGHYFEDKFSRSDSIGGSHSGAQRLDMRLAFGEGWGNAIAGMILGDPRYHDTFGSGQQNSFEIDVENNLAQNEGWYNEFSVQSIVWDIFDAAADGGDALNLGFGPIFDVMTSVQRDTDAFTSLFTFATAMKAQNPGAAGAIDQLLNAQSVNGPGIDDLGSNETNNAGNGNDVLPIYTPLVVGAAPVTLCSTNAFDPGGDGNKLGIHRYMTLTIPSSGNYTVTATKAAAPAVTPPTDPDVYIVQRGLIVLAADSGVADSEVGSGQLAAGEYVVDVSEFNYQAATPAFDAIPRVCFDISIAQD